MAAFCVQEAAAREAAEARELVEEVRAVVSENYLDARGSGWDPAAWDAACRRVLAGPLRDTAAAHRCAETSKSPPYPQGLSKSCVPSMCWPACCSTRRPRIGRWSGPVLSPCRLHPGCKCLHDCRACQIKCN